MVGSLTDQVQRLQHNLDGSKQVSPVASMLCRASHCLCCGVRAICAVRTVWRQLNTLAGHGTGQPYTTVFFLRIQSQFLQQMTKAKPQIQLTLQICSFERLLTCCASIECKCFACMVTGGGQAASGSK